MTDTNQNIRAAAGLAIQKLIRDKGSNVLTWGEIDRGFVVDGEKVHFGTKAAGIFKPQMLLHILKTTSLDLLELL